jgi:hypothetical protein
LAYTQKQVDKFLRQKYISELEKVSKNLFSMFRDESMNASKFVEKFTKLMKRLESIQTMPLDIEYFKELELYIHQLYRQITLDEQLTDQMLGQIREIQMDNLNRLQKLKHSNSHKKAKHKNKIIDEDSW